MELDKILIGERIRTIRTELFKESRERFSERCDMTENHLGRIERGELLITVKVLNKICTTSGIKAEYILYGSDEVVALNIEKRIEKILHNSSKEELEMYFKIISSIKAFNKNKIRM